jgi:hypothetical protein
MAVFDFVFDLRTPGNIEANIKTTALVATLPAG